MSTKKQKPEESKPIHCPTCGNESAAPVCPVDGTQLGGDK